MIFIVAFTIQSCQDDDTEFGAVIAPSNLVVTATVQGQSMTDPNGDGTGIVVFNATSDNALNYSYDFGDGRQGSTFDGTIEHRFVQLGTNTYSVTVTATGTGGAATTQTILLDVLSTFDDSEAKEFLTGGSSKTWYWSVAENGHWGVGPTNLIGGQSPEAYYTPAFFPVPAFGRYCNDLTECFYEDEMVFTKDGNDVIYELKNFGGTYFHNTYLSQFGGPSAINGNNDDECLPFTAPAPGVITFTPTLDTDVPVEQSRKTTMLLANDSFISWYVGSSEYEIMEITANRMVLRTVQANDPALAWYHVLTTDLPVNPNPPCI
ncbi:glycoside hydrolase, family 16 [Nonlabens dokdonensis DSW-6]|uniref:Glycoside hydrolase, family 16 n=2 Tax=Nonlabens dokdonensis TaxID=328515 RepID=L7W8W4_NONDD|nr:glycoside hydrolase, family 16 [Nonlabens dokdonensis DSW-6]